jgi:uncharacterized protein (TIGR02996 family)
MRTCNLETRLPMIRHMVANPDDAAARLVYADHLEESGEEFWAKFLRARTQRDLLRGRLRSMPELDSIDHKSTTLRANRFVAFVPVMEIDPDCTLLLDYSKGTKRWNSYEERRSVESAHFKRSDRMRKQGIKGSLFFDFPLGLIEYIGCDHPHDFATVCPWFFQVHPIRKIGIQSYQLIGWVRSWAMPIRSRAKSTKKPSAHPRLLSLTKFMQKRFPGGLRFDPGWCDQVQQGMIDWATAVAFGTLDLRRKQEPEATA